MCCLWYIEQLLYAGDLHVLIPDCRFVMQLFIACIATMSNFVVHRMLVFLHRALFEPLGMTTAVIQRDPAGNFIMSSHV